MVFFQSLIHNYDEYSILFKKLHITKKHATARACIFHLLV